MAEFLIVVDMQKDFVSGALGTKEAEQILPSVKARIEKALREGEEVIFTRDTHGEDYLSTQEGRKLPVVHCIEGSDGWQIDKALRPLTEGCKIIDKPTFGSMALVEYLREKELEAVTLIGICTDICVISNAMLIKAAFPELPVRVEADCCAGVTPESHGIALKAMSACQIEII